MNLKMTIKRGHTNVRNFGLRNLWNQERIGGNYIFSFLRVVNFKMRKEAVRIKGDRSEVSVTYMKRKKEKAKKIR